MFLVRKPYRLAYTSTTSSILYDFLISCLPIRVRRRLCRKMNKYTDVMLLIGRRLIDTGRRAIKRLWLMACRLSACHSVVYIVQFGLKFSQQEEIDTVRVPVSRNFSVFVILSDFLSYRSTGTLHTYLLIYVYYILNVSNILCSICK